MVKFDIKQAHKMVNQQRAVGNDVEWQGWDIVFYRPAPHAIYSPNGAFRNGQWAFENRVEVNSEGLWAVDGRNLKHTRRARS